MEQIAVVAVFVILRHAATAADTLSSTVGHDTNGDFVGRADKCGPRRDAATVVTGTDVPDVVAARRAEVAVDGLDIGERHLHGEGEARVADPFTAR
jgi:hypothetical protein